MSIDPFNNNAPKKWQFTPQHTNIEQDRIKKSSSNFGWFYNSKAWKTARNKCLQLNPTCQDCKQKGITKQARTVNHITPLRTIVQSGATSMNELSGKEYKSALTQSNLESLCLRCHGIEEAQMIRQERALIAEREKLVRLKEREKKREAIMKSREHKDFDNFVHKIYTDENGIDVCISIF
jgi:5-methylcytosine-specific restriction endonuclease McrA